MIFLHVPVIFQLNEQKINLCVNSILDSHYRQSKPEKIIYFPRQIDAKFEMNISLKYIDNKIKCKIMQDSVFVLKNLYDKSNYLSEIKITYNNFQISRHS